LNDLNFLNELNFEAGLFPPRRITLGLSLSPFWGARLSIAAGLINGGCSHPVKAVARKLTSANGLIK
jgi:hypothetical protein